jgi:hypothetical protein
MPTDLSLELRAFVDSVPSVSLDEIQRRAEASDQPLWQPPTSRSPLRRRLVTTAAVAVLVAGATSLAAIRPWDAPAQNSAVPHALSSGLIRLISYQSSAALSRSGTAQMTVTETQTPTQAPSDGGVTAEPTRFAWSVGVTFSGENLDESIAMTTSFPLGSSAGPETETSHSDLRFVDGSAYRLIEGPSTPPQWYVETGPNARTFLSFPDPRTFLASVDPATGLVSLGRQMVDGVELTHLRANDPGALGNAGIAGLGAGQDSSFDIWINDQHVVQRMTLTQTGTSGVCASVDPSSEQRCTQSVDRHTVDVTFAHVGDPETITAPTGAIPGSWPSN